MFCNECGGPNPDGAKFCNACGKTLMAPAQPVVRNEPNIVVRQFPIQMTDSSDIGRNLDSSSMDDGDTSSGLNKFLAFIVIAAIAGGVYWVVSGSDGGVEKTQEPQQSGFIVHPYELVKNPFQDQHRIVSLELNARPILIDGQAVFYTAPIDPRMGEQYGWMGLRFNKMLSEGVAIYDVLGQNARGSDPDLLGQIAVIMAPRSQPPSLQQDWDVEPKGTIQGTNGFGASISIPVVKFWGYSNPRTISVPAPNQQ